MDKQAAVRAHRGGGARAAATPRSGASGSSARSFGSGFFAPEQVRAALVGVVVRGAGVAPASSSPCSIAHAASSSVSRPRSASGSATGGWRRSSAALYLPLVAVAGTWVLSADPAFQAQYPHLRLAANDWQTFVLYELLYLFYWIGWEYLWRGFVLFGTAPGVRDTSPSSCRRCRLRSCTREQAAGRGVPLDPRRPRARRARVALPLVLDRRPDPRRADAAHRPVLHAPPPHRCDGAGTGGLLRDAGRIWRLGII